MNILATVAARGGSKGVKGKNIRPLAGKPLIAHTIDQVIAWGKYARFLVSTDSEEIASVARAHGADVPFLRPAELATDTAGKIEVLRHAWQEAERAYGMRFDALFDLDATAPIRMPGDMDRIVERFLATGADCVLSATRARKNPYFNMLEENPDGTVSVSKPLPGALKRRQDAPRVFDANASMYVYRREFLLNPATQTVLSGRAFVFEMDELSAYDIDEELDFRIVEMILGELGKK
jgi:CMP-N-acetylneuraminic acid synthetase